jgi:hypothetical protein
MEDILIANRPAWIRMEDASRGKYSPEQVFEGSSKTFCRHSSGYPDETFDQERYEKFTIEGAFNAAKHNGETKLSGPSAPLVWMLTQGVGETMYSQTRSDSWNVPIGMQNVASTCLRATIEHLRSGQEDEIWNELAPIKEIDDNHPETYFWTTNYYEPTMAVQTTQRGRPNVVEAQMRTGMGRVNTYKIKGQVFLRFYKSEMGTAHWHHVLIAMARGLVLAGQYAAAVKLASADQEFLKIVRADEKMLPTFDLYWDHVANYWAYFQRPHHTNVAALRTMFDSQLRAQGAHEGRYQWIITKPTYDCIAKFDEHSLKHDVMSERGLNMLESHIASKVRIGEDDVFVMNPFMLPRRVQDQPFGGPVEIAEHFEYFQEETGPGAVNKPDRFIYDAKSKTITRIPIELALRNLVGAPYSKATDTVTFSKPQTMDNIAGPHGQENLSYFPYTGKEGELDKDVAASTAKTVAAMKADFVAGTLGFNILAIRPHQSYFADNSYYHLTGQVVERVQKSGEAIITDKEPEFLHDITVEAQLGAAAVNPQNIVKAPNTTITGYIAGEGVEPLVLDASYKPNSEIPHKGDILFIAVPKDWELEKMPRNICLHGDFRELGNEYAPAQDGDNWYPGCAFVNGYTHWRTMQAGTETSRYWDRTLRKVPYPSSICSRRMTYMLGTRKPQQLRPGNGFWRMEATHFQCGATRIGGTFTDHPVLNGIEITSG